MVAGLQFLPEPVVKPSVIETTSVKEIVREVPVYVEVPGETKTIEVIREVVKNHIVTKEVLVELPPRYIEKLVEVRVPYDIPGGVDRLSSLQLIRRLEYHRETHQYTIQMFKTGQWKQGSEGLGTIADQEAVIEWYDRIIATVKWMVNQLEGK